MKRSGSPGRRALAAALPVIAVLALFLVPLPAGANVLPESALLVHVQQPSAEACVTQITDCNQIVRSTVDGGRLEFLIFFYPLAFEEQHDPISRLSAGLTWPGTWHLVGWDACGGGTGTLAWDGHGQRLSLSWPSCPVIQGQMFLAARLLIDVGGAGMLDFYNEYDNPVWLGCDPGGFQTLAYGAYAVAGTSCDYSRYLCARPEYCTPHFDQTEIHLTAGEGGGAQGAIPFWAVSSIGDDCPFAIETGADWATATVEPNGGDHMHFRLVVTADASNLTQGSYQTWIQLVASRGELVARCVEVFLNVTGNSGVAEQPPQLRSWGRIKAGYR